MSIDQSALGHHIQVMMQEVEHDPDVSDDAQI